MSKLYFSVVIPTYNAEKHIGRLLDSIQNNTINNNNHFEVIVVDDCSQDRTIRIVREFSASFPLIVYSLEKNSGPSVARNYGVEKAQGDIIVFLDADTALETNVIEQFEQHFNEGRECVVGVYSKNPIIDSPFQHFRALTENNWVQELTVADYFTPACGAIRREILKEIGGFDSAYRQLEDYDIGYKISGKCRIIVDKSICVQHCFSGFPECSRRYFARSFVWTRMFLRRGRFDNWGSTPGNALASILSLFILTGVVVSIFFPYCLIPTAIIFAGYIILNANFYTFVAQQYKLSFLGYVIPTGLLLGIIVSTGATYSVLTFPFKNIGKRWLA